MGLLDRTGQGNHIYRVHYNGQQMELIGGHRRDHRHRAGRAHHHLSGRQRLRRRRRAEGHLRLLRPRRPHPEGDRPTTEDKVQMAFRGDWIPNNNELAGDATGSTAARCGSPGCPSRRRPASTNTRASRATRSTGRWCRWPSCSSSAARSPATRRRRLVGLDAVVHHPGNRWSALVLRSAGRGPHRRPQHWEPVCCLHTPEGSPGNLAGEEGRRAARTSGRSKFDGRASAWPTRPASARTARTSP